MATNEEKLQFMRLRKYQWLFSVIGVPGYQVSTVSLDEAKVRKYIQNEKINESDEDDRIRI